MTGGGHFRRHLAIGETKPVSNLGEKLIKVMYIMEFERTQMTIDKAIVSTSVSGQTRRMAENGFAPSPLGNFADISYLVEN